MKRNIKIGLLFSLIGLSLSFSSCLKHKLPDYPLWDGNLITNVYVEYRYTSDQMYGKEPVVAYQRLNIDKTTDASNNSISLDISVPPASGSFTTAVRNQVSQSDLILYFDLSTAASMAPAGGTPAPGYSTDLTKPQSYVVTAANGQARKWTIKVTSFTK